jgi:hypothetical protein
MLHITVQSMDIGEEFSAVEARRRREVDFGEDGGEMVVGLVAGGVNLEEVGWLSDGVEQFGHVGLL